MILVYKININDISEDDYKSEYNSLDFDELEYLSRYKTDGDIKRSLAAKILLKKAVFKNFKKKEFSFKRNEQGKIIFDFCFVSVSHSYNLAVCAISDKPIGIDIEKIKPVKKSGSYHFFKAAENEYVNSNSCLADSRFLEVWTRKEAYLKCADIKSSELSSVSVLSDFGEYSFNTQMYDGYIISVCEKLNI